METKTDMPKLKMKMPKTQKYKAYDIQVGKQWCVPTYEWCGVYKMSGIVKFCLSL